MISAHLENLMSELDHWSLTLPEGAVRIIKRVLPAEEDLRAAVVYRFEPASSNGCALELFLVDDEDGPEVGLVLDCLGRIAQRVGARGTSKWAGLFDRPRHLPLRHALELVRSVAEGRVEIYAGLWRGRVVATQGAIVAPCARRRMEGFGAPLWLYWLLKPLRLTNLVRLEFEPWGPTADPA